MATTVIQAFDEFMANSVNLDSGQSNTARASRDWLIEQIHTFPANATDFPNLANSFDINFGSFERKTKIRELDDIDIIIGLNAEQSTYIDCSSFTALKISGALSPLSKFCNPGSEYINSIKIINAFVKALSGVSNYKKAEIHRRQEAATLSLTTYPWVFDIVPAFFTQTDSYGRDYYLIPDGDGYWKKTDPRIDRNRTSTLNVKHNGNILNVIRATKYWNRRPTMPSMSSYMLETMILDFYEKNPLIEASQYVDMELVKIFDYIRNNIYSPVYDPKGIQGNLNTLTLDEQVDIKLRADKDFDKACEARSLEGIKDHKSSIKKWLEIFGDKFPKYG